MALHPNSRRRRTTLAAGLFLLAAATPATAADLFTTPLNEQAMAEERAMGRDTQAELATRLDRGQIDRAATGDSMIDGGAFQHATGWINVIQNSGNQVVIQNSVTVSVTLHP